MSNKRALRHLRLRDWQTGLVLTAVILSVFLTGPTIVLTGLTNFAFVDVFQSMHRATTVNGVVPPPIGQLSAVFRNDVLPAASLYRSILKRDPGNPSASYGLGYLSLAIGDSRSAAKAFGAVSNARADQIFVWNTIASHRSGDLDRLSQNEKEAIARKLGLVAYQDLVLGRRDEALAIYETATEIAPELVEIWLDRIHYYSNDWDKAQLAYSQAISIHPSDPFLIMAGAYLSLYANQDYPQGRTLAKKAMQGLENSDAATLTRPYLTWLYNGYIVDADLALQQGDRKLAIAWLRKAIDLPGSVPDRTLARDKMSQLLTSKSP